MARNTRPIASSKEVRANVYPLIAAVLLSSVDYRFAVPDLAIRLSVSRCTKIHYMTRAAKVKQVLCVGARCWSSSSSETSSLFPLNRLHQIAIVSGVR